MLRRQLSVHSPTSIRSLLSGLYALTTGSDAGRRQVRSRLEASLEPREVLFTDSGTSALALALRAGAELRTGPAALPAYNCFDVATAAQAADVPVLLYDVDPETLGPDPDSLTDALRAGASSVVVAHLYGLPVDVSEIRTLFDRADALLIEDAAQGAGSRIDGKPAGSLGSLSILSFARGKGVTGGGGGALLAGDDPGARALRIARREIGPASDRGGRALGQTAAQWLLGRPALYGIPASLPFLSLGETVHRPPSRPRGCPEACLGILSRTWPLAVEELRRRRENASRLLGFLESQSGLVPVQPAAAARPGYLRLPVRASERIRGHVEEPEAERLGIMPGYPRPLSELSGFADRCRNAGAAFPGASELSRRLCTFPTHGRLTAPDLRRLERWIVNTRVR